MGAQPRSNAPGKVGARRHSDDVSDEMKPLRTEWSGDDASLASMGACACAGAVDHSPDTAAAESEEAMRGSSSSRALSSLSAALPASMASLPSLPRMSIPQISRMISEQWVPRLLDSDADPPALVDGNLLRRVTREVLPRRFAIKDWRLLYSTGQHGCSIHTALANVAQYADAPSSRGSNGACLLLASDEGGFVFGAFMSQAPRPDGHYHGTGESCLFRAHPGFAVFRWTRADELFVLCDPHSLGFGSGPEFGLFLDDSFEFGTSGRSATYGNECLACADSFRILRLEIWGFV